MSAERIAHRWAFRAAMGSTTFNALLFLVGLVALGGCHGVSALQSRRDFESSVREDFHALGVEGGPDIVVYLDTFEETPFRARFSLSAEAGEFWTFAGGSVSRPPILCSGPLPSEEFARLRALLSAPWVESDQRMYGTEDGLEVEVIVMRRGSLDLSRRLCTLHGWPEERPSRTQELATALRDLALRLTLQAPGGEW